jgi:hypothetical protein
MVTLASKETTAEPCGWSRSKVQDFAAGVARKLGYKAGAPLEPIVEKLGGKIRVAPEEIGAGTGFIDVRGPSDFVISLSPYSGEKRDRFTISHELGHYVLHSLLGKKPVVIYRDGTGRLEWEANWFAAGFLMPGEEFRALREKGYGDASLAVHFGVSEAAVAVRLSGLGI